MFLIIVMYGLVAIVAVLYTSVFEWTLHRFVMHKRVNMFPYPFDAHANKHHRIFKADETYHLNHERDRYTIPMAWWNGPALILIASLPSAALSMFLGKWSIWLIFLVVIVLYYGAYEYLHWCMHLPKAKRRLIERFWVFYRLNGHHLLHHRYMMSKNFNVVFPFADLIFRTLLLRSPVRFAQAQGPSVPDVQPLESTEPKTA